MFNGGSSKTFKRALIEEIFNVSMLSIIINLSLLLKEDLFKLVINSLIWLISIFFFSLKVSTNNKLGFDPFLEMDNPVYPVTYKEFVDIYNTHEAE